MLAGKIGYFRASLDPAAAAYIAAVEAADGQALEPAVRTAINNFVVGCKADGIWSAIKASCILCGSRTLSGALVPLVGTAPTNFNFVAADYNRKTGLVGNGTTKYLDTNRTGNADPQDSTHMAFYFGSARGTGAYMGAGATANGTTQISSGTGSNVDFRCRSGTAASISSASTVGFVGISRAESASFATRIVGASATQSIASQTPLAVNHLLLARNNSSGVAGFFSNSRISYYSIGEGLTLASLDSRVTALYNAIGAAIVPQVSNADAQSWINRVYDNGGTVSTSTANAVNTFCNSIDSAGIRDRFYRLNLFCGTDLSACLVPLYRGQSLGGTQFGNATDTNNNFVSGDYAETGSTGGLNSNSGVKTLNTGVNPVTVGISFNNTHMSAYLPVAASGIAVGRDSTNSRAWHIYPSFNAGNGFYRSGGTANSGIESVAYSDKTGHILATRTSSSSAAFYRKGVSVGTNNAISNVDAFASNAPGDTLIFGTNFVFNGRLASYSLGVGMTASDAAAFNSAMQAFQAALSRNA
jgi:hypothetical protein